MSIEVDPTQFDAGDEKVKFSDFFIFQKVLGNGSFGVVVSALQKPHMKECAVKIILKKSLRSKNLENLGKESKILQQMNHPNIVKFVAINESETRIFLVMELVRGGQLKALMEERNKSGNPLTDEEAATIMKSIFSGLQYIHLKDIVHRDLKPENILLNDTKDLSSIKICDFGLSAQYNDATCTRSFNEKCGTDIYMAPELWKKKRYSKPVDMWSCGIILYMLLSGGKHPIYKQGDNHESYFKKLEEAQWVMPPNINRYTKDLFLKLVHEDPNFRYTVEQVQDHPWITRRFNEDIPLTSSEKIAAFSHSQVFSGIIKSLYLIHKIPTMPPQSSHPDSIPKETITERPSSKIREMRDSVQREMKLNLTTEKNHDTSNIHIPLPSTEEESPTIDPSFNRSKLESGGLTPLPDAMTRKTSPSISSNIRPIERKESGRDTAVGSSTDLETTQGSNPGSLQEDKIPKQEVDVNTSVNKTLTVIKPMQTEPAKRIEQDIPKGSMKMLWIPERDRSATVGAPTNYTGSLTKRRDVKYTKKAEKPLMTNTGRDTCSIDLGQKWDPKADSSRLLQDKTIDRIRHLDHYGSLQTLENDVLFERDGSTVPSRNAIGNTISVLTPSTAENMKIRGETEGGKLRRKVRKGALEAESLPKVEKLKQRQSSWSVKKKGGLTTMTPNVPINKEKTLLKKTHEISRALNLTGAAMTSMMSEERTPSSKKNIENRPTSPQKMMAKMKPPQDLTRRQTSLLATYKTPTKDVNELMGALPSIKQEIRKTKTTFVSQAERLLQVRNDTAGNIIPHPPPSRFTKAITPFTFKY